MQGTGQGARLGKPLLLIFILSLRGFGHFVSQTDLEILIFLNEPPRILAS